MCSQHNFCGSYGKTGRDYYRKVPGSCGEPGRSKSSIQFPLRGVNSSPRVCGALVLGRLANNVQGEVHTTFETSLPCDANPTVPACCMAGPLSISSQRLPVSNPNAYLAQSLHCICERAKMALSGVLLVSSEKNRWDGN